MDLYTLDKNKTKINMIHTKMTDEEFENMEIRAAKWDDAYAKLSELYYSEIDEYNWMLNLCNALS
jgi:hypothetical protein